MFQKMLVLGVLDFVLILCLERYLKSIAIRYVAANMVGFGFPVSVQNQSTSRDIRISFNGSMILRNSQQALLFNKGFCKGTRKMTSRI